MSTQPQALRLADLIQSRYGNDINDEAAAELRRLHEENFALAAGQCMNVVGDEGGTPMCAKAQQLQSARERDNVSFKELLAQRDALLEALRAAVADWDEEVSRGRWLDAARAAIKAVEEEA